MIPGQGAKIPHPARCSQKKKKKNDRARRTRQGFVLDVAFMVMRLGLREDLLLCQWGSTGLVSFRSSWQEQNREENMDTKSYSK